VGVFCADRGQLASLGILEGLHPPGEDRDGFDWRRPERVPFLVRSVAEGVDSGQDAGQASEPATAESAATTGAEATGTQGDKMSILGKLQAGKDKIQALHEARGKEMPQIPWNQDVTATFSKGLTGAPTFQHDHGHLDDGDGNLDLSRMEKPSTSDYLQKAKWVAMCEGAALLRPDLGNATQSYRHFLHGDGEPFTFDYENFITQDSGGKQVLASAIDDAKASIKAQYAEMLEANPELAGQEVSLELQSKPVTVGCDKRYPYPHTENWQKAIGGHAMWMEARATVSPEGEVSLDLTLNAEDMYNFNRGGYDIASGTLDSVNGRFEMTGLGHGFLQKGKVERSVSFALTAD
jgi:hypothetical protein